MSARDVFWGILAVLMGGCHAASVGSASPSGLAAPPRAAWWTRAAAALAELPGLDTTRSGAGVLHMVGDRTDPRLPVPLEDRPAGADFLALLAATRPGDLPEDLPGLPNLLARVGLEARGGSEDATEDAVVVAFSSGWSLRPLVTDQAVGWLAVLPTGAPEDTVKAAAALLAHLAERPSFSAADVAHCAETLLVTPSPEGRWPELAARAAGFTTAVAAWPTEDALMRVHREDLVRLHRRVFSPRRLLLAGSRPWPPEVRARLDRLAEPAGETQGDEAGLPAASAILQVDGAGRFALPVASLPEGLRASGTALRGPVRAQVLQLLSWVRASGWVGDVTLRTVGGRPGDAADGRVHDVLTGHRESLRSLLSALKDLESVLGAALRPLDTERSGPLVPALESWGLAVMQAAGTDP